MIWLWSLGPLIVVLAAIWLAVGTRRVAHQRSRLADDTGSTFALPLAEIRVASHELGRSVDALAVHSRTAREGDKGVEDADR